MMNLVALAQVLLIFTIVGAVSVYVLDVIYDLNLSDDANGFIEKAFDMFDILGDFGKVIVVVAVVAILVGLLGVRLSPSG